MCTYRRITFQPLIGKNKHTIQCFLTKEHADLFAEVRCAGSLYVTSGNKLPPHLTQIKIMIRFIKLGCLQ